MIFSIAIAGVMYTLLWRVSYFMPGSYGSFFGLIAGPIESVPPIQNDYRQQNVIG